MRTLTTVLAFCCALGWARPPLRASDTPVPATAPQSVDTLLKLARTRVAASARVPLGAAESALPDHMRLGGPDQPAYLRGLTQLPDAALPFAELVHTMLYEGGLPMEVKAAMGLRIAQLNGSPYVAAHSVRLLQSSSPGRALLAALRAPSPALDTLDEPARLAVMYGDSLTRSVHGVDDEAFARTRAVYDDAEVVELTLVTCFFNYFTRYAEAVRLPVEPWALDTTGPAAAAKDRRGKARVALISDVEMAASAEVQTAARDRATQQRGLGLGIANSQRAMLRAPALGRAWRTYGTAVRSAETVGRDIKLQVSLAVSILNDCRYCTLHQVLGLRRLGVDPARLVAMRKDDSVLTPRELAAVRFARKLTSQPGAMTDGDYDSLRAEFGEVGALEVVLQTCGFAFMNRFTDGLLLPSEDEAIRVYHETYGTGWE
jgi:AhpD family alkylhydroperoxidase